MSTKILKAEDMYYMPEPHPFEPAERVIVLHWRDRQTRLPKFNGSNMPKGLDKRYSTTAYISHGRWVAECPGPNCNSAQYVSPDDPRFWCIACENAYARGKWISVEWPQRWEARERVMLERPEVASRTAFPHETLQALKAENKVNLG